MPREGTMGGAQPLANNEGGDETTCEPPTLEELGSTMVRSNEQRVERKVGLCTQKKEQNAAEKSEACSGLS